MSEFDLEEITDRAGTGAPNFTHGFNINGSDSGLSGFSHTEGATEPSSPSNGDTWWNTDNDSYNVYIDGEWKGWLGDTYSSFNWGGDRAVTQFQGNTQMDYFDIASASNAADFGDLYAAPYYAGGGISNGSRGIFSGGVVPQRNDIAYITISTLGNSTDFGDMTHQSIDANSNTYGHAGCSDNTRGLFMGAYHSSGNGSNQIHYITIATTGNSVDFGDLAQSREHGAAASNGTYGAAAGGQAPSLINNIDRVTIQTTGNATDHGDLTIARHYISGFGVEARATYVGGQISSNANRIDSVDLSTSGNGTDYGDLTNNRYAAACTGNADYGVAAGGNSYDNSNSAVNVIDRWSMSTSGNAVDHGDLTSSRQYGSGVSGAAS
jgi:hypothetical protein